MRNNMSDEDRSAKRKECSVRNVKAVRKCANMSQEQFAGVLGVATNTISRIETEKVPLSAEVALKISEKFFVSMDYLFGLSDYEDGDPPCSKTCIDLINAQFLIDIQDIKIKELQGKLETIRKVSTNKKKRVNRPNHSL